MNQECQVMTVLEVSRTFGLSAKTVRESLRRGSIAGFKVGKRKWLVSRSAVERILAGEVPGNH